MANVFLNADETGVNIANNGDVVFGQSGDESVNILAGVTGVVLDQNIETVTLGGNKDDYTYEQAGNQLIIKSGGATVATVPVQGDQDGTLLTFDDGTFSAILNNGVLEIGNEPINPGPGPGTGGVELTLTTDTDLFTTDTTVAADKTTSDADTIQGVVSALTADNTLNSLDKIDGGDGVDTLSINMESNFGGFTDNQGYLKNVENIELTNTGTIGRTFDTSGITGAEKYVLNAGDSDISLSDLAAAGITVDVVGQSSGTTTLGFTTKAVEGTSDALTLGLNGVGTAATTGVAAKYLTVAATGIENLAVEATGINYANLSGAATKGITVSGQGSLAVEAVGAITSFDASGLTGAVSANLMGATAGALATVKGGDADDTFTVSLGDLTANATLDGGAGNNTLKVSGSGTLQPSMTQFQTLELNGVDGDTTLACKNVSDLANIVVKGTSGIGANTVTVATLNTAALGVTVEGAQAAGTLQLTSPTVLTYNTQADAATTTAKGQANVQTIVAAGEATNATINVGAYTKQTGDITVNKATAVTLNVASAKDTAGTTEQTVFAASLTANAAQNVTINADGALDIATGTDAITAGVATLATVTANGGGSLDLDVAKAQQVNITSGASLNIMGSTFSAAEQVSIAANVGFTNGTNVDLGKISTLNLSGSGTASGKESQIQLGSLGSATDITNAITVNASGLKGGAQVSTIDTKGGNVNLTVTDMTGNFTAGNIGSGTNHVGNVTVNAATLGSTQIGTIDTVSGAAVQVNAPGLLGKNASGESLKIGAITVATDSNKNSGNISVEVGGSNKINLSTLQAKTVTLDASGYLGGNIAASGENGTLGTITGQTVTIKGSETGSNAFTIDAQQNAAETTAAIDVTGGIQADTLTIDNTVAFTSSDAVTISFTGGENAGDRLVFEDAADLTNASSKLTLNSVEKLDVKANAVSVWASNLSGATLDIAAAGGSLTLKGTDSVDTIDASKFTTTGVTINGEKGNDTITGSAQADTINGGDGNDIITGGGNNDTLSGGDGQDTFNVTSGNDTISDLAGTASTTADIVKVSAGATVVATASGDWTATNATQNLGSEAADFTINADGTEAINLSAATVTTATTDGFKVATSSTGTITGSAGDDTIVATIADGASATFVGGKGDDTITLTATDAKTAAETVQFSASNGKDTITNFDTTEDKLSFDGVVTGLTATTGTAQATDAGAGDEGLDAATALTDNTIYVIDNGAQPILDNGSENIADYTSLTDVAAYLAEAFTSTAAGDAAVFVINDLVGSKTYAYSFLESATAASTISDGELSLIGVITEVSGSALVAGDIA